MIVLVKLLLAHMLGDFVFQPDYWVKDKEKKKLWSKWLYIHALLHGVLVYLMFFDTAYIPLAIIIAVTHGIIDSVKLVYQRKKRRWEWFAFDQLMHIAVIVGAWYWWYNDIAISPRLLTSRAVILYTAIIALTYPASTAIKMFISKWAPQTEDDEEDSLQNAGKFIGMFERLLTLAFILCDHWEAVGFLITAKSVLRFGDLNNAKSRKLTEYVLVGTLLSFGSAILLGIITLKVLQGL